MRRHCALQLRDGQTRVTSLPAASGTYSSVAIRGALIQIAGQGPMDAAGSIVSSAFEDQARRTFSNVIGHLEAAGGHSSDLLMIRVYLTRPADFAALDDIMRDFFVPPFPARTTVFVGLGEGMLIEVDALAVRNGAGPTA